MRLLRESVVVLVNHSHGQVSETGIDSFLLYVYNVFGNMGNYRYLLFTGCEVVVSEIQRSCHA